MLCITSLVSASPACSASLFSLHALSLVNKSFILAVMVKSFTLDDEVFHSCRDDGIRLSDCRSTPDTWFGDVLHLGRLLGNLCTRAVVMVLTLSGFSATFSIIWSNSSLIVTPGKRS